MIAAFPTVTRTALRPRVVPSREMAPLTQLETAADYDNDGLEGDVEQDTHMKIDAQLLLDSDVIFVVLKHDAQVLRHTAGRNIATTVDIRSNPRHSARGASSARTRGTAPLAAISGSALDMSLTPGRRRTICPAARRK